MGILVIREKVTPEQLRELLEQYPVAGYVKVAVDVEQEILVAGGVMHVDCEEVLLEQEHVQQQNVWGAGWYVFTQEMAYDSFINQRPPQNRSIKRSKHEYGQLLNGFLWGYNHECHAVSS
jgi:hypothetical protein